MGHAVVVVIRTLQVIKSVHAHQTKNCQIHILEAQGCVQTKRRGQSRRIVHGGARKAQSPNGRVERVHAHTERCKGVTKAYKQVRTRQQTPNRPEKNQTYLVEAQNRAQMSHRGLGIMRMHRVDACTCRTVKSTGKQLQK